MKCGPGSDWIARRRPRIGGERSPTLSFRFPSSPSSLSFTDFHRRTKLAESCLAVGSGGPDDDRPLDGPRGYLFSAASHFFHSTLFLPPPSLSPCSLFPRSVGRLLSASSFLPYYDPLSPLQLGIPRKIDYGRHRHGVYKIAYKIALGNKLHGGKEVARRGEKASWAISAQLSVIHSGPYGKEHALRQTCLPLAYFLSSYCLAVTSNFLDGDARMRRRP